MTEHRTQTRSLLRDVASVAFRAAEDRVFAAPAMRAIASRYREAATVGAVDAQTTRRMTEADLGAGRAEDVGWRQFGTRNDPDTPRLSYPARKRAQATAATFYRANPLARRMTDILRDFVCGSGLTFTFGHEVIERIVLEHWGDSVNAWGLKQFDRALDLSLFGEACWPVFRAPTTGLLRLATVYPGRINEVVTDPENRSMVIGVDLEPNAETNRVIRLRTILEDEDEALLGKRARAERARMRHGECFYFAVNALSDDPRGVPDLLPVLDWMTALDRAFENADIRQEVLNAFAWDVTVQGATKDDVEALGRTMRPPPPGGINVHSERQTWAPQAPDTKATDADTYRTSLIRYILTAMGYPLHWIVDGGDANLATAKAMDAPIMRTMRTRQAQYVEFVRRVIAAQVRAARAVNRHNIAGVPDEEAWFAITAPPVTTKDFQVLGLALNQVVVAMSGAEAYGYVDREVAQEAVSRVLAELGIDTTGSTEAQVRPSDDPAEGAPPRGDKADGPAAPVAAPAPAAPAA